MNLQQYKFVFIAIGLIGVLLIASPVFLTVLQPPPTQPFSELHLLNSDGIASDYPYNVIVGSNYSVSIGVNNNLGSSAYYVLYLKIRNYTDSLPNATLGLPSSINPIYEYHFIIQDKEYWTSTLHFEFFDFYIDNNQSLINQIVINSDVLTVNKPSIWVSNYTTYFYQLLFELWVFDSQEQSLIYHNRFVNLPFNLTKLAF